MSKKVAEIIVDTFVSAGVKHCYGIVGDTLNPIAHHMNESDIEWLHVRHEEAGAFAAEGEAMFDRQPDGCRRKLRTRQSSLKFVGIPG
jgi:pyruvate dehydrogenase (quinone)